MAGVDLRGTLWGVDGSSSPRRSTNRPDDFLRSGNFLISAMASDHSTRVTGGKEIQQNVAKLLKLAPDFTKRAVNEFAIMVQSAAKQNITDAPAVDTGRLRASIKIENYSSGFAKRVGSDLKYAPSIEFGSRPHFPPLAPIREWCRRHGIDERAAYPIARKIAERGTHEKPFLFPALEANRPEFEQTIRKAWRDLGGQLA